MQADLFFNPMNSMLRSALGVASAFLVSISIVNAAEAEGGTSVEELIK